MQSKEYKLPNGRKAVFEYDACGIGKVTLECMDELMNMIADRPQGEWIYKDDDMFAGEYTCSNCNRRAEVDLYGQWILSDYCPSCGARMKGAEDE